MRIYRPRLTGSSSNGPLDRDMARFEAQCRELFGGCSYNFHRSRTVNLPYLLANARRQPLPEGPEIKRRVRRWRLKTWARSREVRITVAAIAAMLVLLAFAFAEPCPPSSDGAPLPPDCTETPSDAGMVKVYGGLVLLLAALNAIAVVKWLDRNMPGWLGEPKDDGEVTPPRGRW